MSLAPGTRVGPYEVGSAIGAGGMGEVYRARDTKLGRDVALKILPANVVNDPDRVGRFEREARTLAALNHPLIAHIYGFEQTQPQAPGQASLHALAMEFVEGQDLSQRMARGPLSIPDALPIARQIAEALEYAHAQGIVHRDLKPANIKVRPDGTVKILDFGLAKALDPADSFPGVNAATMTSPAITVHGVILGTAAYMSPEQARGHAVDQRADIWAFGVVLYEMLTGRTAFPGATVTDTLARLIERDPDWTALPESTPPQIRTLLKRCLEKDPRKRAPHIGLARLEVDDALSGAITPATAPSAHRRRSPKSAAMIVAAAAMVAILSAGLGYWLRSSPPEDPAPAYRSLLLLDQSLAARPPSHRFSVSPDGRWLAYVGSDDQSREVRLWLRSLQDNTSQVLPGTGDAMAPFWSPDSRGIAFAANGRLMRIEVGGAPPTLVCPFPPATQNPTGSWGPNDVIVFAGGRTLWRVRARGGTPELLTRLDGSGETHHGFPWILPGGRRLLFTAYKALESTGVFAVDLDTGARTRVMENASNVQYGDGHLLFMRGSSLMAQPFDPATLTLSGEPVTLADAIVGNVIIMRGGAFSASQTGTLVYWPLTNSSGSRLVWSTPQGQQTPVEGTMPTNRALAVSPDGTRAAVIPMDLSGGVDLWIVDTRRGVRSRVTHDAQPTTAVWSHDGRRLYYSARNSGGALNIYRRGESGRGPEELVFEDATDKWITSVSSDGRSILYETQRPGLSWDVFVLTLDPKPSARALIETPFTDRWAQFSPDGQWIAYVSNDSAPSGFEVYVARYPGGAHRTQVSPAGGAFPRWNRAKSELFYYASNNSMMSAQLTLRPDGVDVGAVAPLFKTPAPEGFARTFFDVSADGRFLVSEPTTQASAGARLGLVTNWPALTRR